MQARRSYFAVLASLALLVGWGCGSSDKPYVAPTVPVKGKISFRGKPLTKGVVTFEPVDIGREAQGGVQPDGTFVMSTFKEGDGAVKGLHKVSIAGAGKGVHPTIDARVEVTEGKSEYDIDLK